MSIKQIAGFIFVFVGAFSISVPDFLTRGSEKIGGAELAERYPERDWIRYVYPFVYMVTFFGAAILFFLSFSRSDLLIFSGENWLFAVGGALGILPLMNGGFALVTGVIPINRRRQYLYVVDDETSIRVGLSLIGVGMLILMAAAMAVYFWR